MNIKIPRGDLKSFKINLKNNNQIVDIDLDGMYFTVKDDVYQKKVLFQKKLADGTIEKDENGIYHFRINPEDTDNLTYGIYVCDIEIYKENILKKTIIGTLEITSEVTFASNEEE